MPFDATGQGGVASFATFFHSLGKDVATIFDKQSPQDLFTITASCDAAFEQQYPGFEQLLQAEAAPSAQAAFVKYLVHQKEWPAALQTFVPVSGSPDQAYTEPLFRLFTHKKGDEFLSVFFSGCLMEHFPRSMLSAIRKLREMALQPPVKIPSPPLPTPSASSVFE